MPINSYAVYSLFIARQLAGKISPNLNPKEPTSSAAIIPAEVVSVWMFASKSSLPGGVMDQVRRKSCVGDRGAFLVTGCFFFSLLAPCTSSRTSSIVNSDLRQRMFTLKDFTNLNQRFSSVLDFAVGKLCIWMHQAASADRNSKPCAPFHMLREYRFCNVDKDRLFAFFHVLGALEDNSSASNQSEMLAFSVFDRKASGCCRNNSSSASVKAGEGGEYRSYCLEVRVF